MRIINIVFTILLIVFLTIACGGNGSNESTDNGENENNLSNKLKIFITDSLHTGNFMNDLSLTGDNAIEKADFFCNEDSNKPNDSNYKALLSDGIFRDAATQTNWVLQPNTTYYRSHSNTIIGTTNDMGIFDFTFIPLVNGVVERCNCSDDNRFSWTGINPTDFSTHEDTCNGWSSNDISVSGMTGNHISTDSQSFGHESGVFTGCHFTAYLYCVEQP